MEVLGIEKYESEALNKLLEAFYAIVRKKDGKDNERDIFRVLIIAVDRYLIDKEHKNPIVRELEPNSWGKPRLLQHKAKGSGRTSEP